MRYETMGQMRTRRLDIPQLLGGLNTATDPSLIEDDELSAVCNLTSDHGALVTREAVRAIGDEPLVKAEGNSGVVGEILRRPIEIDGKLCTVILTCVGDTSSLLGSTEITVQVVSLEGECLRTYIMPASGIVFPDVAIATCDGDVHKGAFLIYHQSRVYRPDDATQTMVQVSDEELYAPLVMINGTSIAHSVFDATGEYMANGVMYEGFNTLTDRYRAQFTSDVGSTAASGEISEFYALPTTLADGSELTFHVVTASGEGEVTMTVGADNDSVELGGIGTYKFFASEKGYVAVKPPLPQSAISNTVTVTCERDSTANREMGAVTQAIWFGGTQNKRGGTRLFLANPFLSKLMWSDVNDPFYFPENNYMYVGDLSQKITALEKQGDMLVVFKEREMFYTTYVQGEIDAEAIATGVNVDVTASQAYFPLTQLSPQIGCRCPNSIVLCRDRLVWMDSDARVYTLVIAGTYSERNVREIGSKVRTFLLDNTTESQRKNAGAVDHKGKYRVMIGNRMVEFDYNDSGFVNVSSYASGERAARNIAWYTHYFEGFGEETVPTLIGDGADKALLISTSSKYTTVPDSILGVRTLVRVLYAIEDGEANDRYLVLDTLDEVTAAQRPIAVSLTTKNYDFADSAAYKRIGALFVMMRAEQARVWLIADGEDPMHGIPYQSEDLHAHLVMPSIKRCRTFALRIEAEGKLCVKGLRMQYAVFGTVK